MNTLRITLLGKLEVRNEKQQLLPIEARRAQELLGYLLLYRERLHEREKLATLLWPDGSPERSKRNLRQTLWQLQAVLHHQPEQAEHLLLADYERLGINPRADYWLDVALFDQAFSAVEKIAGKELSSEQATLLQSAVSVYQGDLLEGWYQDWCIYERERYQNIYLVMLDKLLRYYAEVRQDFAAALACGGQILRYDHAREQTHRYLMRLHYKAGDRTAAIHQYDACVTALRQELDVGPTQSTVALYKQICAAQPCPPDQPLPEKETLLRPQPEPQEAPLQILMQIHAQMAQLQEQVSKLIQTLS